MRQSLIALCALILTIAGCATSPGDSPAETGQSLTAEEIATDVLAAMDMSADPCEDFYRFACGNWLDTTERPADQSRWVRSFSTINERNREVVREILEQAAADPGNDPDRQRIGYYYGSCMDEERVEQAGAAPLHPIFEKIGTVEDAASLLRVTGQLHRWGIGALFGVRAMPDFKDPDFSIAFMFQGGLGMPDRDYYVSDDPKKQELLAEYEKHVARMFGLLGEDEATAARHASEVLALETELARNSRTRTQMRDREKLYNKIDITGLKQLTPKLDWDAYLGAIEYPDVVDISVATPEFFEALEGIAIETPTDVLQTYLRWHAVNDKASLLSTAFVDADFDFFGRKVAGQDEIKPRWKRCVDATQRALGEAVGQLYVQKMFAGASKQVALEMIHDIESAFQASLPGLAWMDDTTRARAMEKLGAVGNKIGYPDKWRDYSSMQLTPESYFDNAMAAAEFRHDYQADKIGNPVDRTEWSMSPQMVNAYNNPVWNEIVFPAGILQPPFFHKDFPAAMNYGAIGGVIGHELTHGYDDQGRKFNPQGKLEEWWEPEVAEKFESAAQCIDDFYSQYEVEPGAAVNGKLTLGENIADLGGLKQAHAAYRLWEQRHGDVEPAVEGLTNEQLLFVSWGQIWCAKTSDDFARLQVTTDSHSPSQFRVTGPVSHNAAFAAAFQCEVGAPMRPEEQCEVW